MSMQKPALHPADVSSSLILVTTSIFCVGYMSLVSWIDTHSVANAEREASSARAMTLVAQAARVSYEKTLRYGASLLWCFHFSGSQQYT